MNEKTEFIKEDDYLYPPPLLIYKIIPGKCEKLINIKENIDDIEKLTDLVAGCKNTKYGYYTFESFIKGHKDISDGKIENLYRTLEAKIDNEHKDKCKDIVEELITTDCINRLRVRGYTQGKKGLIFNPNDFANHITKRLHIISFNSEEVAIYNKNGYFERTDPNEVFFAKIVRKVMNEGLPTIWNSFNEKEAVKAIQRSVHLVNNLATDRSWINLKNGMLNLETFNLVGHSP